MEMRWPGVKWKSNPPSCYINGLLMLTGGANANYDCPSLELT